MPAKKTPAKKRSSANDKRLKAEVKKLRAQLAKTEAKLDRWKSKSQGLEQAAATARAEGKKLAKRLDKATRKAIAKTPAARVLPAAAPDQSWTVAQLRSEARTRDITGFSRMTKAELLRALK